MRELIGRGRGDDGASMVLVAITLVSLLGFAAIAVDTAAMVQERRTLQNSADAAALALADDCSGPGCGDALATAEGYTDANADDGFSTVEQICGSVAPLAPCADVTPDPLWDGYVRVSTKTSDTDGSDILPFSFARILGFTGTTVHMRALAAWGVPTRGTSKLPLTIGMCEWQEFTNDNTTYAELPLTSPPAMPERIIKFHNPNDDDNPCQTSNSGADIPGGFGWLEPDKDDDDGCRTTSDTTTDEIGADPGNSSPCDFDVLESMVGTVVFVPVYDKAEPGGSHGTYHIISYAAFYLTGFKLNGNHGVESLVTGDLPCGNHSDDSATAATTGPDPAGFTPIADKPPKSTTTTTASTTTTTTPGQTTTTTKNDGGGGGGGGNDTVCISGYFVRQTMPGSGPIGGGPSLGLSIVSLQQ